MGVSSHSVPWQVGIKRLEEAVEKRRAGAAGVIEIGFYLSRDKELAQVFKRTKPSKEKNRSYPPDRFHVYSKSLDEFYTVDKYGVANNCLREELDLVKKVKAPKNMELWIEPLPV